MTRNVGQESYTTGAGKPQPQDIRPLPLRALKPRGVVRPRDADLGWYPLSLSHPSLPPVGDLDLDLLRRGIGSPSLYLSRADLDSSLSLLPLSGYALSSRVISLVSLGFLGSDTPS